jgi:potassium channel subfamily K
MNDPGFDDAIKERAKPVDRDQSLEPDGDDDIDGNKTETYLKWVEEDRELDLYLQPTRWWFASTEIPLIAVCVLIFHPLIHEFPFQVDG